MFDCMWSAFIIALLIISSGNYFSRSKVAISRLRDRSFSDVASLVPLVNCAFATATLICYGICNSNTDSYGRSR